MNHGLSRGFRCGVLPRQTQTNHDASGSPQRVAGRPLTSQTAFGGQLPYKESLVRPVARCDHNLSEYNVRLLRATNHEQRATIFSRAEGHSRRCRYSEFIAAYVIGDVHRIHAGRPLRLSVLATVLRLPLVGALRTRKALGVPYGGGRRAVRP